MSNYLDLAIFLYLADGKPKTATYLARKFEVCTKTIYRHVNNLVFAGLPISTTTGKTGGILLNINAMYTLNNFTQAEIDYLKKLLSSPDCKKENMSKVIYAKLDTTCLNNT